MSKHAIKSKQTKLEKYDPSGVGVNNGNLFGLPFTLDESAVAILPVPWDVTTSYAAGTSNGPSAILVASPQLDLIDENLDNAWQHGIAMLPISQHWLEKNNTLRSVAKQIIDALEAGETIQALEPMLEQVNFVNDALNKWVELETAALLTRKKLVGIVGGEHSVPLGFLRTLANHHNQFGILQIDAHCDLRASYEGFTFSHASIMYNALQIKQVSKLVQVGIRDFAPSEQQVIAKAPNRIACFSDQQLKANQFAGATWHEQCETIIHQLPQKVYISFDIDGLDPALCPNTGTPVPGGLTFQEALYLLNQVVNSGREIIGFDLCEVAPGKNEWDASVGARVLYKLSNLMIRSNKPE